MPKPLKIVLFSIGALLVLVLALAVILAATFDPNDYKPQLIRLVQDKTQRTLAVPGDIKLTFFPKIGADLGQISLSEHKRADEFASVNSAKVSLELLPMLSKRFVVDQIMVDGLKVNVHKFQDGTTNIDDLMSPGGGESQQVQFNVDGISVTNAALSYRDDQAKRTATLTDLDLTTGPIANGEPSRIELTGQMTESSLNAALRLDLRSGMTLDFSAKRYVLEGLDASMNGKIKEYSDVRIKASGNADIQTQTTQFALDNLRLAGSAKQATGTIDLSVAVPKLALTTDQVSGAGITGEGALVDGQRIVNLKLAAPAFKGSPKGFNLSSISIDATVDEPDLKVNAKIASPLEGDIEKLVFRAPQLVLTLDGQKGKLPVKGSIRSALTADLGAQQIDLDKLAIDLRLPNPRGGTLDFKAAGDASANLDKQAARAALAGTLDGSDLNLKLGMSNFAEPAYTLDARLANLDLDRYRAQDSGAAAPPAAGKAPPAPAAEQPIDLSALKTLNATGKVQIGALKASNLKASSVRLDFRAARGRADINPLSANLYGGSLTGALSATAADQPRFTIKQSLTGVNIGPLLKDLTDKDLLDGRGQVTLDLATTGATVSQLKKALDGNAQMSLRDGAIRGVNIAGAIREAKARIGVGADPAAQAGASVAGAKTDFTELTGSFKIANGIARNNDLEAKSPLLRIAGSGDINIGEDRLDYLVKATVVSTLQGQGGPELQALRGVTIPVRLSGPYHAIAWNVDVAGMASALAKAKVDEKKEEVRAEVEKRVGEQRGKIEEEVRDRLKGLFGK